MNEVTTLLKSPFAARLLARLVTFEPGLGPGVRVPDALRVRGWLTDAYIFYPNDEAVKEQAAKAAEANHAQG